MNFQQWHFSSFTDFRYFSLLLCVKLAVIWLVSAGEEFKVQHLSTEQCQNIGSIKGMVDALDSIEASVGDIISAVKYRIQEAEEDICLKPKFSNQTVENVDHCLKAKPDCYALQKMGFKASGVYRIWPRFLNHSIQAYCDMETDGGGWTLIQRRGEFNKEKHTNFYETWNKYKTGFGNLNEEFWLGNDFIFALSQQAKTNLRIDLEDFDGEKRFAKYSNFLVRSELESYMLTVGEYEGNAGDSLKYHSGEKFSTKDRGNACPKDFKGGWWYKTCHEANLNGIYHQGNHSSFADGINWLHFRGYHHSMKVSEMKIRRCNC